MSDAKLYDTDFALWSGRQADAIRRRADNEIDWDNVAEEIESLGNNNRRELAGRISTVLVHLLKTARLARECAAPRLEGHGERAVV